MSVNITSVTIDSVADRRLTLGNAHWAATLDIGSSWTKLRIGARVCWEDFGANLTGTPRFYLGAMASPSSSLQNGPLSDSCSHFIGMRSNGTTWTRSAANGYYTWGTNSFYCKKVNATVTTGSSLSASTYVPLDPTANRTPWVVEIDRISGVSTGVTVVCPTGSAVNTYDVSLETLRLAMEQATIANVESFLDTNADGTYAGGTSKATIATDEGSDGTWNAICCAWDRTSPLCYISEMLFAKIE